jgi:hypothetical protein
LLWLRLQFEHADKSENLSEGIPPLSVDLMISGVSVLACIQVPHFMVIIDAPSEVIMQLHEVNVGVSKQRIQGAHYEELLLQLLLGLLRGQGLLGKLVQEEAGQRLEEQEQVLWILFEFEEGQAQV